MKTILTVKTKSDVTDVIHGALDLGLETFRINFARRSLSENLRLGELIRRLASARGQTCVIFGDTAGTKFRVASRQSHECRLAAGANLKLAPAGAAGDAVWITDDRLIEAARSRPGLRLVFATGLELISRGPSGVDGCGFEVAVGGGLYRGAGFGVDGDEGRYDSLSSVDCDLVSAIAQHLDVVDLSFADTAQVVKDARTIAGPNARIIAKIESPAAVENLEEILAGCDGAMLARGDLSRWFGAEEMSEIGRRIHSMAKSRGAVTVFATDYFKSLAEAGVFRWAEHRDLADACRADPDYLLVNETSHVSCWREVLRICAMIEGGTFFSERGDFASIEV